MLEKIEEYIKSNYPEADEQTIWDIKSLAMRDDIDESLISKYVEDYIDR